MAEAPSGNGAPKVGPITSLPQYSAQVAARAADMQGKIDVISELSEAMVRQTQERDQFIPGTTETPESLLVKRQGQLEAQRQAQRVAQAADWENTAVILARDISTLAMQKRDLTAKIQQDASVSLFDDPLTAIANAFTLPWDQQALDATSQKLDAAASDMQKINAHVQQSAQTAEKIATQVTAESIASTSAAIANLFKTKEISARIDAAKQGAEGIQKLLAMDAAQADALIKITQERDREEARAQRNKVFELQVQEFNRKLKKDVAAEEGEEAMFRLANAALINDGKSPLSRDAFNITKRSSAAFIDQLVLKGLRIEMEGPQNATHGSSIQERFNWQGAINWQPKTPQQERVMLWQKNAREAGAVTGAAGTGKDKQLIAAAAAETTFKTTWDQEQRVIQEGSPFKAPAWEVIAKNSPSITSNPIWKKYIEPRLAADPNSMKSSINEAAVVESAAAAVLNKEVTSAQAAKFVKHIFDTAVNTNNRVHEFNKIANREQTKYGVSLGFGTAPIQLVKKVYDLTDPVQVEAAIQAKVVTELGLGLVPNLLR